MVWIEPEGMLHTLAWAIQGAPIHTIELGDLQLIRSIIDRKINQKNNIKPTQNHKKYKKQGDKKGKLHYATKIIVHGLYTTPAEWERDSEGIIKGLFIKLNVNIKPKNYYPLGKNTHNKPVCITLDKIRDKQLIYSNIKNINKYGIRIQDYLTPDEQLRRRQWYPVLKEAKKQNKKVRFINTQLYIDDQPASHTKDTIMPTTFQDYLRHKNPSSCLTETNADTTIQTASVIQNLKESEEQSTTPLIIPTPLPRVKKKNVTDGLHFVKAPDEGLKQTSNEAYLTTTVKRKAPPPPTAPEASKTTTFTPKEQNFILKFTNNLRSSFKKGTSKSS